MAVDEANAFADMELEYHSVYFQSGFVA